MITHWAARPIYPGDDEHGIVMFSAVPEGAYPEYTTTDGYTDIAEAANALIAERDRLRDALVAIAAYVNNPLLVSAESLTDQEKIAGMYAQALAGLDGAE